MELPFLTNKANAPQRLERLWPRGTPCPFDEIIDVRSPAEFADDHLPGAINLPVLNDVQRVEVGTLYRQAGAFAAAKVGAAYVSANIGTHLGQHFAEKGKDYKPLVYCWRGGQRSASIAHVLASIGWRATVLDGGYKTYRKHVLHELETVPAQFQFRVVSGMTGSGKTLLLHELAKCGAQVIDLEQVANHRGSVLGELTAQPSQKRFDSQLLALFDQFDPHSPVWVEAEGNRLGNLYLPAPLLAKIRAADGMEIRMPVTSRVQHLIAEYAALRATPMELKEKLRRLAGRHGATQIECWCRWSDEADWAQLTTSLLALHYDPAYAASTLRDYPNPKRIIELEDCSPENVGELARLLHLAGDKFGS
jgi:tRNA 2-selenouridine synthase